MDQRSLLSLNGKSTLSALLLAALGLIWLVWCPATILLPLARLLALIWSIAAGLVLALGKQRETGAGG